MADLIDKLFPALDKIFTGGKVVAASERVFGSKSASASQPPSTSATSAGH